MCTQSKKSSFLRYLTGKIIKQTKESSFIFISVLFWLRSIWFRPFTLEPNGTFPNGTVPSAEPKEHAVPKWNGSTGYSVNSRPIRTILDRFHLETFHLAPV